MINFDIYTIYIYSYLILNTLSIRTVCLLIFPFFFGRLKSRFENNLKYILTRGVNVIDFNIKITVIKMINLYILVFINLITLHYYIDTYHNYLDTYFNVLFTVSIFHIFSHLFSFLLFLFLRDTISIFNNTEYRISSYIIDKIIHLFVIYTTRFYTNEMRLFITKLNTIFFNMTHVHLIYLRKEFSDKLNDTEKECSICIDTIRIDECIKDLPCKHDFHTSCLNVWLDKQNTCPLCRTVF
jgi:hypothetical protein